jgi:hypothetical protein
MLIQDTDGNLLGGFTPVEWDSKSYAKGDNSLRRFLFTLRNLCGVVQRKETFEYPFTTNQKRLSISVSIETHRPQCGASIS